MRRFRSHSLDGDEDEGERAERRLLLSSPRFCIDPKASSLNTLSLTVPPEKHKHFITVSRGYSVFEGQGREFVVSLPVRHGNK